MGDRQAGMQYPSGGWDGRLARQRNLRVLAEVAGVRIIIDDEAKMQNLGIGRDLADDRIDVLAVLDLVEVHAVADAEIGNVERIADTAAVTS